METVKEKIAYLRGMLDSSGGAPNDEQMKLVFQRFVEVLSDLADDIDDLFFGQEEIEEYVEAIDADLADLEDSFYEGTDDEYADDDYDTDDDYYYGAEDLEMVEMECPNCHEPVVFEEDFLYDDHVEVTCPECGDTVYISEELDDQDLEEKENE